MGQHGEQYTGWKRLAAPPPVGRLTIEGAAVFIACQPGSPRPDADLMSDTQAYRESYRYCAAMLHPDNPATGDADKWRLLGEAKALLDAHHGIAITQEARP